MSSFDDHSTHTFGPDENDPGIVTAIRVVATGIEHPLDLGERRWVMGSSNSCDIVVADPYVSAIHCTLERRTNGVLMIRDRKSRNGTIVDRSNIESAELRVGSTIRIGRTTLVAVSTRSGGEVSAVEALRGRDPVFRRIVDQALRVAQTDCNVLVLGETGTGKDMLARAIHEASRRSRGRFVPVNCGAIPRELIGSELFGHERGAFTGAMTERDGYFVEAHGGTLFLDELGELPIEMQPNLLRAIESRHVRRVGGQHERAIDVRIVAATNRIEALGTDQARIRMDLYHRIATVVFSLPPLRERMGDLAELVNSMLDDLAPEHNRKHISEGGWKALCSHTWPGNIRELRHAVQRAVTLATGPVLTADDFFDNYKFVPVKLHPPPVGIDLVPYEAMMRGAMEQALERTGSIRQAALQLGMAKSTFADKAKAWGLLPPRKPKAGKTPPLARRHRDDDDE